MVGSECQVLSCRRHSSALLLSSSCSTSIFGDCCQTCSRLIVPLYRDRGAASLRVLFDILDGLNRGDCAVVTHGLTQLTQVQRNQFNSIATVAWNTTRIGSRATTVLSVYGIPPWNHYRYATAFPPPRTTLSGFCAPAEVSTSRRL